MKASVGMYWEFTSATRKVLKYANECNQRSIYPIKANTVSVHSRYSDIELQVTLRRPHGRSIVLRNPLWPIASSAFVDGYFHFICNKSTSDLNANISCWYQINPNEQTNPKGETLLASGLCLWTEMQLLHKEEASATFAYYWFLIIRSNWPISKIRFNVLFIGNWAYIGPNL